jgi:elongation factor Ts
MEITADMVQKLKLETSISMMTCKKALQEANGNFEEAKVILRKQGMVTDAETERKTKCGIIYTHMHDNRIGVMLELNCVTDFVARNPEFKNLAKVIAMHITWANPKYIKVTDIPQDILKFETDIIMSQIKPEQQKHIARILPGKLSKFYKGVCLMEQDELQVSEGKKTIAEVIGEVSRKFDETIVLTRFVRYFMGETDRA